MKYFLHLQKFTFCHGYKQDLAISPFRQEPTTWLLHTCNCWERSRCAQEWPWNISATLDLHNTCCCHCCPSPGEMLMGCSVSSTQGRVWWVADLLLASWQPQNLCSRCGRLVRSSNRGPWGFLLSPFGFIQLSPGHGKGAGSPGWQQVEYQSAACPVPTMFQAQHPQLLQQSDCPALFCTGDTLSAVCGQF